MKKQINLIIGVVLVLIIAVFSYLNRQLVTINFGVVATTMPLIVVLIACVLLGIILATLFTANSMRKPGKKITGIASWPSQLGATNPKRNGVLEFV